jgi:putative tricarboxylic transport membrane protein
VKVQRTDFFFGLSAIALAGAYYYVATGIQESMLSDATGAGGVPRALAWAMGALGLLLCARSVSFAAGNTKAAAPSDEEHTPAGPWQRNPHVQALVLLGLLVAYVVLAPYLGYIVATTVLIAAAAAYGGAAIDRNLLLISASGGIGLWVVFAKMLGISMQGSVLLDGF